MNKTNKTNKTKRKNLTREERMKNVERKLRLYELMEAGDVEATIELAKIARRLR